MTPSPQQNKSWRQCIFLVLTIIVIVMLMMHPELRLFLPLLDALGLELLLAIMASQFLEFIRPALHVLVRHVARPLAAKAYALVLFLFGIAGPYVDASVTSFIASRRSNALAAR